MAGMSREIDIRVRKLTKHYKVPVRDGGFRASVASLFRRKYRIGETVKGVSFDIARGEIAGSLGPNGAGRTTTLQMLAAPLRPASAAAQVRAAVPRQLEAGA